MNIPADLKYTESHEWVRQETDGTLTVGITEYAQDALGDIVFVELPQVGKTFTAGDDAAVVESVKAASDIYAPVSGTVTAVNQPARPRLRLARGADRRRRSRQHPPQGPDGPGPVRRAAARDRRAGEAQGHRRQEQGHEVDDRPGLLRHHHAARGPAQRLREPG